MIRIATLKDFDSFFKIKSEEDNMFWCGYDEKPVKKNLLIFWKKHILEKTKRIIYMVEWGGQTVGYIYVDNNEEIELSVGISCYYAGQGIATNSIRDFVELLSVTENKNIIAYIREDNVKSQRVFEKVGFKITDQYRTMNFTSSDCAMKLYKWIYQ